MSNNHGKSEWDKIIKQTHLNLSPEIQNGSHKRPQSKHLSMHYSPSVIVPALIVTELWREGRFCQSAPPANGVNKCQSLVRKIS